MIRLFNEFGWTTDQLSETSLAFLEFVEGVKGSEAAVLDIGAGYGVATLPALNRFEGTVIANDVSHIHLKQIAESAVAQNLLERLRFSEGSFPRTVSYSQLTAIHCSNVIHFLEGPDIELGARKMFSWLLPGGRAFVQAGTPFQGNYTEFIGTYTANLKKGLPWPGEMRNAKGIVAAECVPFTPNFMNLMTKEPLTQAFILAGFEIDRCWYYRRAGLPEICWGGGQENIGLIAIKPGPRLS